MIANLKTMAVLGGLLAIAILIAIIYIMALKSDISELTASNDNLTAAIAVKIDRITELEVEAAKSAADRALFITTYEEQQREKKKLEDCIADKSCGFTVRVRTQTVYTSEGGTNSQGDPPGAETQARLAPDSERAYFRHTDEIDLAERQYDLCLSTLERWRHCGGK